MTDGGKKLCHPDICVIVQPVIIDISHNDILAYNCFPPHGCDVYNLLSDGEYLPMRWR